GNEDPQSGNLHHPTAVRYRQGARGEDIRCHHPLGAGDGHPRQDRQSRADEPRRARARRRWRGREGGRAPSRRLDAREAESGCTGRTLPHLRQSGNPHTSGAIAGDALAKLGILDEVQGKTHHAALTSGGELVAKGEVEMGFFNLSEVPKGVTVAGPLPGPLQGYTFYEAAVLLKGS